MIGKRVKATATKSGGKHAGSLVDYITKDKDKHKVMQIGGKNFISDRLVGQRLEMMALAGENPRSKNPLNHYVLSWREQERPTPEEIEAAVDILLAEMEMQEHQVIYAAHQDTHNIHVHVVINRIHPDTIQPIQINRGFDIEALHRSVTRIEHTQGWQPLENAKYQIDTDGKIVERQDYESQPQPQQRAADFENRTGQKSAQRIGIETLAPIVKDANDWQQLHRQLATVGAKYQQKGTGAIVTIGETVIKASSIDRTASLGNLQKRLGTYEPPIEDLDIAPISPQPLMEQMPPGWQEYTQLRTNYYTNKTSDADALRQKWDERSRQLAERQKQEREELLSGRWEGKGAILNALRHTLAEDQKEEKQELQQQQEMERERLREEYQPFPSFEEWQRLRGREDLAEKWRYRHGDESPNLERIEIKQQREREVERVRQERGMSMGM
jgi:Relaxase/Mobilisation nuclease domain